VSALSREVPRQGRPREVEARLFQGRGRHQEVLQPVQEVLHPEQLHIAPALEAEDLLEVHPVQEVHLGVYLEVLLEVQPVHEVAHIGRRVHRGHREVVRLVEKQEKHDPTFIQHQGHIENARGEMKSSATEGKDIFTRPEDLKRVTTD